MQIKVATSELLSVLTALSGIKSGSDTMELYKHAKLTATGTGLSIEKANSFLSGSGNIPAQVQQPGAITLDLSRLSSIVRTAYTQDKDSELSILHGEKLVTLSCAGATYHLPTLDPNQYPVLPEANTTLFAMDGAEFAWAMGTCNSFKAKAHSAVGLTGAQICSKENGEIRFYASDQKILSRVAAKARADTHCQAGTVLLPGDAIAVIARIFTGADTILVETDTESKIVVFTSSHFSVKAKFLEAQYPEIDSVINALKYDNAIGAKADDLLGALSRIAVVVNDKHAAIFVAQRGEKLYLSISEPNIGDAVASLPCELIRGSSHGLEIYLNALFLENAVAAGKHRDSQLFLKYSDRSYPISVTTDADDSIWVIMPLSIQYSTYEQLIPQASEPLKTVPLEQVIKDIDLQNLVKTLPLEQQDMIIWRLMGYTQREIGEHLDVSRSSVAKTEKEILAWLQEQSKQAPVESLITSLNKQTS